MRRFRLLAGLALLLTAAGAGLWWYWPALGDPLDHLPRASAPLAVVAEERAEPGGGRLVRYLTLDGRALGPVRVALSLPDPLPARPVPVLVIVGGLRTGRDALRPIEGIGGNALIAYEYPIRRVEPLPALLWQLPALRRQAFAVPGQIQAVLDWARAQPWADAGRVTPVGVSLGALFMPAALALDQQAGRTVERAVLAYGGADIAEIARFRLRVDPAFLQAPAARAIASTFQPLEPALHLPKLRGEFLVLGGTEIDTMIPEPAFKRMLELLPAATTVRVLPGGHLRGAVEAARLLVPELHAWLGARGAVEP